MADQSVLGVEDVIITDELDRRLSRAPDHEIENRILTGLAEMLASNPENLLQELTDQLVEIGVGESAGISLEEGTGDGHIFRWVAVSGEWLPFSGGTMPFAASPCGVVVTRKETLLFRNPERVFPAANVDPLIGEVLLVPFQFDGKPAGTVWAIKHRLDGRFDAEDARMLNVLSRFASAAYRAMKSQAEVRESEGRQGLLLAELQHRVRNILAMVRSVVRRTGESCDNVDDYVRHLDGRLSSLARVQAILTRESGRGVDLHGMVFDELKSQGALPCQYQIEGPKVELSPKAAEVLGLAVHELATNSTKYGVLSESSGTIRIRWSVHDHHALARLRLTWNEPVNAVSNRPARTGFGTDLIENRVPYELRGTGQLLIGDEEVEARIDFPLTNGPSKLEIVATDRDMRQ